MEANIHDPDEIGTTPSGYTIFRAKNKDIGGYDYISDALADGYIVIRSCTTVEELELILKDMKNVALTESKIGSKVIKTIAQLLTLERDNVLPDQTLYNDLGMDALNILELMLDLEYNFEIKISDKVAFNFNAVKDIILWLESQLE